MAKKTFFKQSANISANAITTLLEVSKPSKFLKNGVADDKHPQQPAKWRQWLGLAGITTWLMIMLVIGGVSWWYIQAFNQTSGTEITKIISTYWKENRTSLASQKDELTFLLLGLDQSQNQRENSMLTDTIIVAKYWQSKHKLTMFSLPRDLWIDSLKTKINALYYYGQQDEDNGGITLVSSVISEISGLPIDYYVIVNMDTLKQVVDAVGGVEVVVERSFTDELYPREIDLSATDPAILYETVTFNAGSELMNGERALKYIRSRHSKDEIEGTDDGREARQQRLLTAIKTTLMRPEVMTNPSVLGRLYKVWKTAVNTNISDSDLITLARGVVKKGIQISAQTIPVKDVNNNGLIFHPIKGPANQWVYLPVDPTWSELRKWFNQ